MSRLPFELGKFIHPRHPGLSLTLTLQAQGCLQGGDQGELALVAEIASEVIQVNGPDHGTSEVVLLKPISLCKDRGQLESFDFLGLYAGSQHS